MNKYHMTDLMEIVNKIRLPKPLGGLTADELDKIYGTSDFDTIMKMDIVSLIEKYKQWETGYRKGEIVSTPDGQYGVVTFVNENGDPHVLCENGMTKYYGNAKLTRTGKTMNVSKFLKEIKGIALASDPKQETEMPDGFVAIKLGTDANEKDVNLTELLKKLM